MDHKDDISDIIRNIENNFIPMINPDNTGIDEYFFSDYKEGAIHCFSLINSILSNAELQNLLLTGTEKYIHFITNSLILCGEHHNESYLWCDKRSEKLSSDVVNKLCRIFNRTIEGILVDIILKDDFPENSIGMMVLKSLRPKLLTDTWKQYPGAVACYRWITMNIKIPHMCEYMYVILPTVLNIMDDYEVVNKVLGLQCLTHILRNLTTEQVKHYCSIDLLYGTVNRLLFWREEDIVMPLISCIIEIAKKNSNCWKRSVELMWCEYLDETFSILLPMIPFEQNINLQTKYIEGLYLLMASPEVKLSFVRWSHRLIPIFECYSIPSHTSLRTMQIMNLYLEKCYPVLHKYGRKLAIVCGKVIYRCADDETYKLSCRCYTILYEVLSSTISLPTLESIIDKRKSYMIK